MLIFCCICILERKKCVESHWVVILDNLKLLEIEAICSYYYCLFIVQCLSIIVQGDTCMCVLLTSMSSGTLCVFIEANNSMMGTISKLSTEMML